MSPELLAQIAQQYGIDPQWLIQLFSAGDPTTALDTMKASPDVPNAAVHAIKQAMSGAPAPAPATSTGGSVPASVGSPVAPSGGSVNQGGMAPEDWVDAAVRYGDMGNLDKVADQAGFPSGSDLLLRIGKQESSFGADPNAGVNTTGMETGTPGVSHPDFEGVSVGPDPRHAMKATAMLLSESPDSPDSIPLTSYGPDAGYPERLKGIEVPSMHGADPSSQSLANNGPQLKDAPGRVQRWGNQVERADQQSQGDLNIPAAEAPDPLNTPLAQAALRQGLKGTEYDYGYNPTVGYVGDHSTGSEHYTGQAADVNADSAPGGEGPALATLEAALRRSGVPTDELMVEDSGGPNQHLHVAYPQDTAKYYGVTKVPGIQGLKLPMPMKKPPKPKPEPPRAEAPPPPPPPKVEEPEDLVDPAAAAAAALAAALRKKR